MSEGVKLGGGRCGSRESCMLFGCLGRHVLHAQNIRNDLHLFSGLYSINNS